jgi:hypothetical protein
MLKEEKGYAGIPMQIDKSLVSAISELGSAKYCGLQDSSNKYW